MTNIKIIIHVWLSEFDTYQYKNNVEMNILSSIDVYLLYLLQNTCIWLNWIIKIFPHFLVIQITNIVNFILRHTSSS